MWGPLAGCFAKRSPVPLEVVPITGSERYQPYAFEYPIAMGVRKGDELRERLDQIIVRRGDEIRALLERYGVPML